MLGHYLMFEGNCMEALELYKDAFNAKVEELKQYKDLPANPNFQITKEQENHVLNCNLKIGKQVIMCADAPERSAAGKNMSITFTTSDDKALQHAWDTLQKNGEIYMELQPTFFAKLHGSLQDPFGVNWMFTLLNDEDVKKPKPQYRFNKALSEIEFTVDSFDAKATVVWQKRNEFLIKKGAILRQDTPMKKDGTPGFSVKMGEKIRDDNKDKFKNFKTTEDIILKSVNEAGLFLYFGGTNSWLEMFDKDGKTIHEWAVVNH